MGVVFAWPGAGSRDGRPERSRGGANGNTEVENNADQLTTYSWDIENRVTGVQLPAGGLNTMTGVHPERSRRDGDGNSSCVATESEGWRATSASVVRYRSVSVHSARYFAEQERRSYEDSVHVLLRLACCRSRGGLERADRGAGDERTR